MKKLLILLLICIFIIISADKKDNNTINRTIMVMPIYNLKSNSEYDYLTDVIRDTIRAKLDQKNLFNFIDFSEIDQSIKKNKLKDSDYIDAKKSTEIALSFGADVIVLTKYAIEGENILIISQAYDMLYQETSVVSSVTGSTGIEIFNNIEKLTDDMADKMAGKFKKIERVVLEKLILKQYGQQRLKAFQDAQKNEENKTEKKEVLKDLAFNESLVLVKGGTFIMGNKDGGIDEKNEHEVEISDFYISKYEVTQKEYKDITGKTPSFFSKSEGFPLHNIKWEDAIEFCNLKSEMDGLTPVYTIKVFSVTCNWNASGYRLPTEAEWEYAARGGALSKGYTYSGSNELNKVGNCLPKNNGLYMDVGSLEPNELGIYDMTGNASEWCWDFYKMNYYKNSPKYDPKGPEKGDERVIRGGNKSTPAKLARVTFRSSNQPDKDDATIGFRLARNANPTE